MKNIAVLVWIALITSCSPIYVNYDYDKGTDFSRYKTYNYYSDMKPGLTELDTKRLLDALDNEMSMNGFVLAENPDFFIDIKSSEFQPVPRSNLGFGVGGGGGNVGGGVTIGIPVGQATISRHIIFEFVDEKGKGLFWQAISESAFNPNAEPEKREAQMKAIVEKVLSKYPPKK